jgi:diguanylate cyclase (GGDEF)-like protein
MPVAAQLPQYSSLAGTLARVAPGFVLPLGVFGLALVTVPLAQRLPPALAGITTWGPLWALVLAAVLASIFNRGRIVFAVLCLMLAFAAIHAGLLEPLESFHARATFTALSLLVPLDLAALVLLRERGVFNLYGMRRLGAIALQIAAVAWVIAEPSPEVVGWAHASFAPLPLPISLVPQLALLVMLLGVIMGVVRAVAHGSALDAGLVGAMACYMMACASVALPSQASLFIGAGAAALLAAVLQETFRLAFRDALTGLPSRRALDERLLTLGARYTVAMVDIDHFKRFNDTYGHELGDHVLRMVAAKLRGVGGGGRAYRYGGEEFTLLFPGRRIAQAWPHLEALRREVALHPMVLRSVAEDARGTAIAVDPPLQRHTVHITISIGVAERNDRHALPAAVVRAADRALYRAKQRGRDRVSL